MPGKPLAERLDAGQLKTYCTLVRRAVKQGKSSAWLMAQAAMKGFTIGESQARMHLRRTKRNEDPAVFLVENTANPEAKAAAAAVTEISGSGEEQMLMMRSKTVRTLEDALRVGKVDLTLWDVERFVINKWDSVAKVDRGGVDKLAASELWQVKVWFKAKKGWNPTEFKQLLHDDLAKLAPVYKPIIRQRKTAPLLAELSIFDAHFGKLAWKPESTQNYDLKICRERYVKAGEDLLARAAKENPERILYVVGNDFFHTDQGRMGTTTNGTPQDCDGRWQKAFRQGKDCVIHLAELAAQIAPVDIITVPGNHDAEKVFCLGEVLDARFRNHPAIKVSNTPDVYNYYRWGKVLLGFVHGDNHTNNNKRQQLIVTMMNDRPQDWGDTVWREVHLGHFHSEMEDTWITRTVEHVRNVAVRVLPSLSSTDAWHRRSGYASVLAAECHLYHKDLGRYAYLVHCAEG